MDEGRVLRMPIGEVVTILRSAVETGGALLEFQGVVLVGASGPPPHPHLREEEAFTVVEGRQRARRSQERCAPHAPSSPCT